MTTFPITLIPAVSELDVDIADGWLKANAPGTLLALAKPIDEGEFQLNVLITVEEVSLIVSVEQASKTVTKALTKLANYSELSRLYGRVLGHRGFSISGAFNHGATRLFQTVHLIAIPDGKKTYVVQAVGTHSVEQRDTAAAEIKAILDSIVIR
jgi:hypothetical protein